MKKLLDSIKGVTLQDITNMILIAGVFVALWQLKYSTTIDSARLMIDFNNQLRNCEHNYCKILNAIDNDLPLLKPKGEFNDIDIDNFLVEWELLNQLREKRLISDDMSYDAFSYEVERTWRNKEIQNYIAQNRQKDKDPSLYVGVQELAQYYSKFDKIGK